MRLERIAVLVSGGGSNLQAIIDASDAGSIPARIVAVIADREAYGLERARKAGIPAYLVDRKQPGFHERIEGLLESCGAQAIVLAGYLSIVDPKLVERFRNRIVNIHPSLIPSFCGMGFFGHHVHEGVIRYGCKVSGATVHFVDGGADTGPIIAQRTVPVYAEDSAGDLAARVLEVEHQLLPEAVALLCQGRLRVDGRIVTVLSEEEL